MSLHRQLATLSFLTILMLTSPCWAALVTVNAQINDITNDTTQDYVFTNAAGSITLRALYTATGNGVAAGAFTSLDGATRVGNSADSSSDTDNHFRASGFSNTPEGFNVAISLLNADSQIDTSSIQFRFTKLGVRGLGGGGGFDWSSSATSLTNTATGGSEQDQTLDTNFYSTIGTTPYSGTFVMTEGLLQLSSVPASGGITLDADFSAAPVPEPSSFGMIAILFCCILGIRVNGMFKWAEDRAKSN